MADNVVQRELIMYSPVRDLIFKKIFTRSLACTIDMLNSLLGLQDESKITQLTIANNEYLGDNDMLRTNSTFLDLHCQLFDGTHVCVEVCRYQMKGDSFLNRMQIYSSEVFLDTWKKSRVVVRSNRYLSGISRVRTIVLVDFNYNFLSRFNSSNGIHRFQMHHVESRVVATDFLQDYIFVDLPEVKRCLVRQSYYENNLKGWLMLLTCHDDDVVQLQESENDTIITIKDTNITVTTQTNANVIRAFEAASIVTEPERVQLRIEDDLKATLELTHEQRFQDGIEQGIEQGLLRCAKRMKQEGYSAADISQCTNLVEQVINAIEIDTD